MNIHAYKGLNSTRAKMVLLAFFTACYFLIFGLIDQNIWLNVTLGSVIAYAFSEVGVKAAAAYRNNNDTTN